MLQVYPEVILSSAYYYCSFIATLLKIIMTAGVKQCMILI